MTIKLPLLLGFGVVLQLNLRLNRKLSIVNGQQMSLATGMDMFRIRFSEAESSFRGREVVKSLVISDSSSLAASNL